MPPPKRHRQDGSAGGGGGGGGGGGSPPPALKKRCRSFDLEIRGYRHFQEFATGCMEKIEAAISRIPEEMTKVLTSFFNRVPAAMIEQNPPPTCKLSFVNGLTDEIFTKKEVRAADGGLIKIRVTVNNQQGRYSPRLLSARVKIVVLDGDFNTDNHEGWTSEEFESHIVCPRDKVGVVLTGDLELKLKNGEAYLENATFVDNSRFTRSGKFRLGVRLIDDLGERVQEGITEPFIVKDRRGEGYKKSDIPSLDDEVWRLKKIAKDGVFHKALKLHGIHTVEQFLRRYHKDAKDLRDILSKASQLVWTTIVDHAKKCDPGRFLYSHYIEDRDIRLYFNSVGQIIGATIADQYSAFGEIDTPQKALLEEWSKDAYDCITYHQPDYEMCNNSQPRQINHSTFQGSVTAGPESTEPNDKIYHEADPQNTSKGINFSGSHSQQCVFRRLNSMRVTPLPSAHENIADASFHMDTQLSSGPETQYETPAENCIMNSVMLHCPATAANETTGSVALDQGALTMDQGSFQMPLVNHDSSLSQWCQEQQATSQCASPFCLADLPVLSTQKSFGDSEINEICQNWDQNQLWQSFLSDDIAQLSAPNVSNFPADAGCSVARLASCRRWIKLTALVKWMTTRAYKSRTHA